MSVSPGIIWQAEEEEEEEEEQQLLQGVTQELIQKTAEEVYFSLNSFISIFLILIFRCDTVILWGIISDFAAQIGSVTRPGAVATATAAACGRAAAGVCCKCSSKRCSLFARLSEATSRS